MTFILCRVNNGLIICYGSALTSSTSSATKTYYPVTYTITPRILAAIYHNKNGYSHVAVDSVFINYFAVWAFWDGQTYSNERFSYLSIGT